jgi:hypothetical protein
MNRRFATLDIQEIRHLLQLTMDVGVQAATAPRAISSALGALAAEFSFELWSREKDRRESRYACGRAVGAQIMTQ